MYKKGDIGGCAPNRRGQEGVTLTTILLMILGIVVVVLVILFATGFFDKLNDATDKLPGSLQTAVSACEVAADAELTADYCSTFRKVEINGKDEYRTCFALKDYTNDLKELTECSTPDSLAFCKAQELSEGTMVNSVSCPKPAAA